MQSIGGMAKVPRAKAGLDCDCCSTCVWGVLVVDVGVLLVVVIVVVAEIAVWSADGVACLFRHTGAPWGRDLGCIVGVQCTCWTCLNGC